MAEAVTIDLNDFSLGEMEELEEKTGIGMADLATKIPLRAVVYMLYMQERRTNPEYTLEDARAVKLAAINVGDKQPDPTTTPETSPETNSNGLHAGIYGNPVGAVLRQQMGVFAELFGYTPQQFRALTVRDFGTLSEYISERAKAN